MMAVCFEDDAELLNFGLALFRYQFELALFCKAVTFRFEDGLELN